MNKFLTQSFIVLATIASAAAARAQSYDLSWSSIDCGGTISAAGGPWQLGASTGQPDAGPNAAGMSGGQWTLVGGFQVAAAAGCPGERGDANCDGTVDFFDIDPFLLALFDPTTYNATYCNGSNATVDANCSSTVDFFDIDPFLTCLFAACPPCP